MFRVKITTGRYLPVKEITNEDFVRKFGKSSPRALEKTLGTKVHRIADKNEHCSDLLVKTANSILKKAKVAPNEITQIIVSTTPPEMIEPATACLVQGKLQAGDCPVFDLGASCSGWLSAVNVAIRLIATSDKPEKMLVLANSLVNRIAPKRIVQHEAIFGDGSGGALLETCNGNGSIIYGSEFRCLGEFADIIHWPAPWSFPFPSTPREFARHFYMGEKYPGETKLLFRLAEVVLPPFIASLWKKTGFMVDDIDFAIVHQPSKPLFEKAVECLEIPPEKIPYNFDRYGNTIAAELPMTLDEAIESDQVKKGDLILLVTFGAGITLGAMLMRL